MKLFIILFIVFLNCFSVAINWKMLGNYSKGQKVSIILAQEIFMLILSKIIYLIGSRNIEQNITDAASNYLIFTFLPINVMIMACPFSHIIEKKAFDKMNETEFSKKMLIIIIISIIVIFIECKYLNGTLIDITKFKEGNSNVK